MNTVDLRRLGRLFVAASVTRKSGRVRCTRRRLSHCDPPPSPCRRRRGGAHRGDGRQRRVRRIHANRWPQVAI